MPPTNEHPPLSRINVYLDNAKEWRWTAIAANNSDILADSSEGHKNLVDCINIANELFPGVKITGVPSAPA